MLLQVTQRCLGRAALLGELAQAAVGVGNGGLGFLELVAGIGLALLGFRQILVEFFEAALQILQFTAPGFDGRGT